MNSRYLCAERIIATIIGTAPPPALKRRLAAQALTNGIHASDAGPIDHYATIPPGRCEEAVLNCRSGDKGATMPKTGILRRRRRGKQKQKE